MSTSPSSSYLSTSQSVSRPALPSRAVGMVVDISPPAKNGQQRAHGMEKAGRSSTSAKSSITSEYSVKVALSKYCAPEKHVAHLVSDTLVTAHLCLCRN